MIITLDKSDTEIHKKGWGQEVWITNNQRYCGKLLQFDEYKKCSFHYHKIKLEHFYVSKGSFLMKFGWSDDINESREILLNVGDVFYVPTGLRHQMIAQENGGELIEISTQHFEDDSYRVIKGD